jgi:hypothetical protein
MKRYALLLLLLLSGCVKQQFEICRLYGTCEKDNPHEVCGVYGTCEKQSPGEKENTTNPCGMYGTCND